MVATFGKLQQADLQLQPGLNLIYAPNESGKSTWTAFIRTMLYGLSTRERGALADKNRYAPWDGSAMHGRMDVIDGDQHYTITRNTKRATSPMGDFTCTYGDTATPVPDLSGQNLGESLLGVPREVFERSAFIRQNALAVDQDTELERRIAALITTGEEDTSYTEAYDRLKKQLNRRKHNKTGLIPTLEREIDTLDDSLAELSNLTAKSESTQARLSSLEQNLQMLQTQDEQWIQLEKQDILQKYRAAQRSADEAQQRADLLSQMSDTLPDQAALSQLDGQAAALASAQSHLTRAEHNRDVQQAQAERAQAAYVRHPLYPADEGELERRNGALISPTLPGKFILFAGIALFVAALMILFLVNAPWKTLCVGAILCSGVAAFLYYILRRRKVLQQTADINVQKATLTAQIAEYLPLQKDASATSAQLTQAQALVHELSQQYQQDLLDLLAQVQLFQSTVNDLPGIRIALQDARRKQEALQQAQNAAQDASMRCRIMAEHLPSEPLPDPDAHLPHPEISHVQISAQIPQLMAEIQASRTQLDTLQGQIQAIGNPAGIMQQRQQKAEQLSQLQAEYDALQLAMNSLEEANLTLQNRFSPALGARAAEIFSDITQGRYHKVLLSRDFSLSAESQSDPTGRSIQLLSQGAADQLYLAVRLAICDMVLPEEKFVPLILDDVLLTFDEQRMHAALDYLLKESQKRQIILFSCQKREQAYLAGHKCVNMLTL